MQGIRGKVGALLIALVGIVPAAADAHIDRVEVDLRARVRDGVERLELQAFGSEVNVARIDGDARVALRVVQARGLEKTSTLCKRVGCIAAVNGDFFRRGLPVGAVVSGGEILRSPHPTRPALVVERDGDLAVGRARFRGSIETPAGDRLRIAGVNVPTPADRAVLRTRAAGRRVRASSAALVLRFRSSPQLIAGQTIRARVERLVPRGRRAVVPTKGAVIVGRGAAARELRALWRRGVRHVLVHADVGPRAAQAIGGYPTLLRGGRSTVPALRDGFTRGRHPRTLIGWDRRGTVWLVTVDGRAKGRSRGVTLLEAARLMRHLGATEAMNLDGGGSTTFVLRGAVMNRPSDVVRRTTGNGVIRANVERRVTNALVLVPASAARVPALRPAPRLPAPRPRLQRVAAPQPAPEPEIVIEPAVVAAPVEPLPVGSRASREAPVAAAVALLAVRLRAGRPSGRRGRARSGSGTLVAWLRASSS